MGDETGILARTADIAAAYLASLAERPVGRPVDLAALQSALGGALPDDPVDPCRSSRILPRPLIRVLSRAPAHAISGL